jgi:hypothetical protein
MFGRTITTRFQPVKISDEVSGKCLVCGKKKKRMFSVENTINPYNKNEHGEPKTYSEVSKDVNQQLREFLERFSKRGFKCATCEDSLFCRA